MYFITNTLGTFFGILGRHNRMIDGFFRARHKILRRSVDYHRFVRKLIDTGRFDSLERGLQAVNHARNELVESIALVELDIQYLARFIVAGDKDGEDTIQAIKHEDEAQLSAAIDAAQEQGIPVKEYLLSHVWGELYV